MIEADRAAKWAWTLLRADTASGGVNTLSGGRIYRDLVPQSAALPAVVITTQAATDDVAIGGHRVTTSVLLNVRVVTTAADYVAVKALADRVDTVLDGATGSQDTVLIGKTVRDSTQQYLEVEDGITYANVVQLYRTRAYTT